MTAATAKRSKAKLTPLVEKHFNELRFDLRLKFKDPVTVDGAEWPVAYVGADGPVKNESEALVYDTGPFGESRHFLVRFFVEDSGAEWLRTTPERYLEVVSSLGEM